MTFAAVPVGSSFWCNGNWCVKRSQRTATITFSGGQIGPFYFKAHEVVTLGRPE